MGTDRGNVIGVGVVGVAEVLVRLALERVMEPNHERFFGGGVACEDAADDGDWGSISLDSGDPGQMIACDCVFNVGIEVSVVGIFLPFVLGSSTFPFGRLPGDATEGGMD